MQKTEELSYLIFSLLGFCILCFIVSCNNQPPLPKPKGYPRIDLPSPEYKIFDSTYPYRFEYSKYSVIEHDKITSEEPFWMNIYYPAFKARIHLSYKNVRSFPLSILSDDAHNFVYRHAEKAIGITEKRIFRPEAKIFGFSYNISGKEVASPFQFWITDSISHYVRGSVYFSLRPNNDSLRPVIEFIVNDISHMIDSWSWKN